MRISVKNHTEVLIFHTTNWVGASIRAIAVEKQDNLISRRVSSQINLRRHEDSAKNHTEVLIFHTANWAAGVPISFIAELNLKFSSRFLRRKASAEWRLVWKKTLKELFFHTAICFWAKANSPDGRRETACADFSSPLRVKTLRNED